MQLIGTVSSLFFTLTFHIFALAERVFVILVSLNHASVRFLADLLIKFYEGSKTAKFSPILSRFYQSRSRLDGAHFKTVQFFWKPK